MDQSRDRKNRGPVSQQVWHDKDPSLLNGHKARANAWKKPFSGNGECTIYKQDSKQYTSPSKHHRTHSKRWESRIFKIPWQTKKENYKEKKNTYINLQNLRKISKSARCKLYNFYVKHSFALSFYKTMPKTNNFKY